MILKGIYYYIYIYNNERIYSLYVNVVPKDYLKKSNLLECHIVIRITSYTFILNLILYIQLYYVRVSYTNLGFK